MTKKKITLLEIVAILTLLSITLYHIGFFNQPEIFPARQTENSDYPACPDSFYYQFSVPFANIGSANAELCVNVLSDDIDFKKTKECMVIPHNKDSSYRFLFDIDTNSFPKYSDDGNASIILNWQYKRYYLNRGGAYPCNYRKEKYDSEFRLVESP